MNNERHRLNIMLSTPLALLLATRIGDENVFSPRNSFVIAASRDALNIYRTNSSGASLASAVPSKDCSFAAFDNIGQRVIYGRLDLPKYKLREGKSVLTEAFPRGWINIWDIALEQVAYSLAIDEFAAAIYTTDFKYIAVTALPRSKMPITESSCRLFSSATRIIEVNTGSDLPCFLDHPIATARPIAFDSTGTLLAAYQNGTYSVWRVVDGSLCSTISPRAPLASDSRRKLELRLLLTDFLFSPDSALAVVRPASGPFQIWSVCERLLIGRFGDVAGGDELVRFSANGQYLLMISRDCHTVKLLDVPSGVERSSISIPGNQSAGFCDISPDADLIAVSDDEGGAYVYSVASRRVVSRFNPQKRWQDRDSDAAYGPYRAIRDVSFCPSGKLLATGKGPIWLWKL